MPAELRNPAGHWVRFGTTLKPAIAGDNIATTGNVDCNDLNVGNNINFALGGVLTETTNALKLEKRIFNVFGDASYAQLNVGGTAAFQKLSGGTWFSFMQVAGLVNGFRFFDGSSNGKNRPVRIYGYPIGLSLKYTETRIANINGAPMPRFDTNADGHAFTKSVENPKMKLTTLGGYAIRLTNRTGSNTVAGQIVKASTATDDAFALAGVNELMPIGVILESGVSNGSEAWIVVSGIVVVLVDAGGCARGDRLITAAIGGFATVNNAPSVAVHFQEIGHSIETRVGAGLVRCVVHFN